MNVSEFPLWCLPIAALLIRSVDRKSLCDELLQTGKKPFAGRRFDEAADRFERAALLDPRNATANYLTGSALEASGQAARAEKYFHRARCSEQILFGIQSYEHALSLIHI